jgi:hypothetical protein
MAKRKKESLWDDFLVIGLFFAVVYYSLKWTIKVLIIIITKVVNLINLIIQKVIHKQNMNNITKTPFKDNKIVIKNEKTLTIKDIKERLGLFDKDIYNDLFPIQIRHRGEQYYYDNKIKNFDATDNKYTCIVEGKNDYNVAITFKVDNDNEIESSNCTCPYYQEDNKNCKHIYALLYKIKCKNNKEKILEELNKTIGSINTMLSSSNDYITKNSSHFTSFEKDYYNNYSKYYKDLVEKFKNYIKQNNNEDILLQYLSDIINCSTELKASIKNTLNTESTDNNRQNSNIKNNNTNKASVKDERAGLLIADEIDKKLNKDDEYDEELEKEMNAYDLEEWQKDLVRKGEYDPWNFEEDNLEEDDYYYEDDK